MTAALDDTALDSDPLALRLRSLALPEPSDSLRRAIAHPASPSPTARRVRRGPVLALGAGVVAISVAVVTPIGATLARGVLPEGLQQRLGLVEGSPQTLQLPDASHRHPGVLATPNLTLAQAQAGVDFRIPAPTWLPHGVAFGGALVDSPTSVVLHYAGPAKGSGMGVEITEGSPTGGSAVPSGSLQAVSVNGAPAFFAHGSYVDNGAGTSPRWDPQADAQMVTWTAGGFTYTVSASGLHLSKNDVLRFAESLR